MWQHVSMAPLSQEPQVLSSSKNTFDYQHNSQPQEAFDFGEKNNPNSHLISSLFNLVMATGPPNGPKSIKPFTPSIRLSSNPLSINSSTTAATTTGSSTTNGPNNGPNSPGSTTNDVVGPGGTGGGGGRGHGGHGGPFPSSNQSNGSNNGHGLSNLDNESCGIRDVWASNLEDEFRTIRSIVNAYPYIAMDTEFPGVVARPIGEFKSNCDYQYNFLKVNVDLLKIIQLGLTFLDEHGKPRPGISTWQFNFKFNLAEDMFAQESIELLQNSGIQFKRHEEEGIDVFEFAELLMTSGVVLNDHVKYLSFHSGYDFGYLLKILTDQDLPQEEAEFFELLRVYFPVIYDVKYLMKSCKDLKGGLQEVSDQLEIQRVGPQHQAGSDALLTGAAFFKMREMFFEDNIDDVKYCGHLYGLGTTFVNGNGASIAGAIDGIVTSSSSETNNNSNPPTTSTSSVVVSSNAVSATTTSTVESSAS